MKAILFCLCFGLCWAVVGCDGESRSSADDDGTSDTDTDTDSDSDADTDTDTDGDVDSDSDTDTDTDTASDTGCDDTIACDLGTYVGYASIETQSQLEELAGYTEITSNLSISMFDSADLCELICLTSVGGLLEINYSDSLTSLDGLDSLVSVGGLTIGGNPSLTSADALGSLSSVGTAGVRIISNGELGSLDMGALTTLDGPLEIGSTDLTSLEGLSNLVSVNGDLRIGFSEGLNTFGNEFLESLELASLTEIGGELTVRLNPELPYCEICDLVDQLTSGPTSMVVNDNLMDDCWLFPDNCP